MRGIPDHPEIEWALRTGYPSWMQEREVLNDEDEEEEEFEEAEIAYED